MVSDGVCEKPWLIKCAYCRWKRANIHGTSLSRAWSIELWVVFGSRQRAVWLVGAGKQMTYKMYDHVRVHHHHVQASSSCFQSFLAVKFNFLCQSNFYFNENLFPEKMWCTAANHQQEMSRELYYSLMYIPSISAEHHCHLDFRVVSNKAPKYQTPRLEPKVPLANKMLVLVFYL